MRTGPPQASGRWPGAALILCCLLLLAAAASAAPVIGKVTTAPTPAIAPKETTAEETPAPVPTRAIATPVTTTPAPVKTAVSPAPRPVRTTAAETPEETPEVETTVPAEEWEETEAPDETPWTAREEMTVMPEETVDTHGEPAEPAGEGREGTGASEPFTGDSLMNAEDQAEALSLLQEEDPAVQDLRGDDRSVSVTFARKASILGIISLPYNETVTVDRAGQVRTDTPWWIGFAQPGAGGTLQKQQQIIQALSNVAKMMSDEGSANSTRKIG